MEEFILNNSDDDMHYIKPLCYYLNNDLSKMNEYLDYASDIWEERPWDFCFDKPTVDYFEFKDRLLKYVEEHKKVD